MGEPPSSRGAFHVRQQVSGVMSETSSGPWGGIGLSGNIYNFCLALKEEFNLKIFSREFSDAGICLGKGISYLSCLKSNPNF